jgi:DNA-binding protein H-NS
MTKNGATETGKPVAVDLDAMTVPELRALIAAAEIKARDKLAAAQAAVLSDARAKLAELGVSLDSLLRPQGGPKGKAKPAGGDNKLPVKYRGPDGQEWSGRGKLPQWLAEAEKQGKSRDEFLARK